MRTKANLRNGFARVVVAATIAASCGLLVNPGTVRAMQREGPLGVDEPVKADKAGETSPPVASSPADPEVSGKTTGLRVTSVLFDGADGFPVAGLQMKAGGDVVMTFRAAGFERLEGKNDAGYPEFLVNLSHEVELRDPKGVLIEPPKSGRVNTTLTMQDDKWTPLMRWSATVPAWAPSGTYSIRIHVQDEIGKTETEHIAKFQVRGESVAESDTFQLQQVEFARSEDGPWATSRYFALRDPIFVRFKIVGFQVSESNRVSVAQDWAVLNGDGKVLVAADDAAHSQTDSPYPPRFLDTNFHLELQDPKPGAYTLRITIRDLVGDQTATIDAPFTLRP